LRSLWVESIFVTLILASASPRRQELLRNAGIPFLVQASNIDESPLGGESATDCARRLARQKALVGAKDHGEDFVLGADTIVVVDDRMLGKPSDEADSARMLRLLSGRTHKVITGVCVVGPAASGKILAGSESTTVTMANLTESEIREYSISGEPRDKAGGYAIQGMASRWIQRIEGDYCNVMGLPVALVYRMLREMGAM
jgi:septum formation protein